jgi:transglutaminase-like putative cysteine protease
VKANTILWVLIGSLMSACSGIASAEDKATGASQAWTSDDPRVAEARELVMRGEFSKAEKLLAGRDAPADAEMRDVVGRLRREYSVDEDALLKKLDGQITNLTAGDLHKWRDAGELQYRVIDGQVRYFRREPSNLFRFSEDAKARRKQNGKAETPPTWKLTDHLAKVVAEAEHSGKTEVVPVKHRIAYTLTVPANARGAKAGSVARIWLPFPQEYRQQTNVELLQSVPTPTRVADNGTPQRTLYFERTIEDPAKPIEIRTVFTYTSYAYYPQLDDSRERPLPTDFDERYLAERKPHVALTPEMREKVRSIVGGEAGSLAKARKIFHWIDANVKYCAEEEYGVIPSISTKALRSLKGDCGVQGTLFITMCRAAGVPARWQSGWETKPVDWNMHDWAEFYVEPWGWLPADVSYGLQKSEDPKVREFYFGHQDSYRMIVNLDYGRALVPPKTSLRSEPADFQRGEVEIDGRNLYFDEWEYDFSFEQEGG